MSLQRKRTLLALGLALLTAAAFWPVLDNGFINFDDPPYLTNNPHVRAGITVEGVRWALSATTLRHWHPLTWLSHMMDCQLFGMDPRGHHLTSLLLHAASTVLLFFALSSMTGSIWRPAVAAALFAVHPLRVESVAWAAERKDVLAALFWVLALLAYARYVRMPSGRRYAGVATAMALGLLAKPMAVTLPLVLLLLDYWPLCRLRVGRLAPADPQRTAASVPTPVAPLLWEKAPLLALSAILGIVYLKVQASPVEDLLTDLTFGERVANAVLAYVVLLAKTLWPTRLALFYPHPFIESLGYSPYASALAWQVLAAAAALLTATGLALWSWRRLPFLTVGWLWYLGTLIPVVGLAPTGEQAIADRYSYVPSIGLSFILVWGVHRLVRGALRQRPALCRAAFGAVGAAAVLACVVLTRAQVRHWRDSVSILRHTLAVTSRNEMAHFNLAGALAERGDLAEAEDHYRKAISLRPTSAVTYLNLGVLLRSQGRHQEALQLLLRALEIGSPSANLHLDLAATLDELGRAEEALGHLAEAIRIDPSLQSAYLGVADLVPRKVDPGRAAELLARLLVRHPDSPELHELVALLLDSSGQPSRAAEHRAQAARLRSPSAPGHASPPAALERTEP